jgi:putative peptidoglycan lipid II flippase
LYYAIGLSGYSLSNVLSFAFYSVQDTKTPVVTGLVRLGLKILLSCALVGSMAHAGLALAESLSYLLKALLLLIFLPRTLRQNGYREVFQSFAMTIVLTAGMAAIVLLSLPYFQAVLDTGSSRPSPALAIGVATVLGGGSYLILSVLLQWTQMSELARLVRAGFKKP